jgi:hypothetical protein
MRLDGATDPASSFMGEEELGAGIEVARSGALVRLASAYDLGSHGSEAAG